MEESESMGYVSGSTVVEMSYIMPLILLMFVLIIHTVFYFYDRAVLNGAAAEDETRQFWELNWSGDMEQRRKI